MAQDGDIVPTHLDDDDRGPACPHCGADAMNDVVTIAPLLGEPGLIAYGCPRCGYVMSVLQEPQRPEHSR
jgi:DNA-directed RNA polymerase subunit RPC12/RpoP